VAAGRLSAGLHPVRNLGAGSDRQGYQAESQYGRLAVAGAQLRLRVFNPYGGCQATARPPDAPRTDSQNLQQQIDSLGLRLLAVDGSTVHLPLVPAMARSFGSHCELPVARLSMLYDVADGQTLHSLIVTPELGERDCAHLHLDHVPADSLILFDRGYPGHWLFALLEQQQRHFLMRLPRGYNTQVKQFLQSGKAEDTQLFAASHPEARLFCTESGVDPVAQIELRLVRVELPSGKSEVLLTSLLDRQALPAEVFADLYHRRWGIETDYRRLKQTLCLDNFSGRSVTAVKQDFHAAQLLKNLALLMQQQRNQQIDKKPCGQAQGQPVENAHLLSAPNDAG
jgi:hypothetical protein